MAFFGVGAGKNAARPFHHPGGGDPAPANRATPTSMLDIGHEYDVKHMQTKFNLPRHPIMLEHMNDKLEPPADMVARYKERARGDFVRKYSHEVLGVGDAATVDDRAVEQARRDMVADFSEWLRTGSSKLGRDPTKALPDQSGAPHRLLRPISRHPTVMEYIDAPVRLRYDFDAAIAVLRLRYEQMGHLGNASIDTCYLYYKFVVLMQELTDDECLRLATDVGAAPFPPGYRPLSLSSGRSSSRDDDASTESSFDDAPSTAAARTGVMQDGYGATAASAALPSAPMAAGRAPLDVAAVPPEHFDASDARTDTDSRSSDMPETPPTIPDSPSGAADGPVSAAAAAAEPAVTDGVVISPGDTVRDAKTGEAITTGILSHLTPLKGDDGQPRDAQGRFVKKTGAPVAQEGTAGRPVTRRTGAAPTPPAILSVQRGLQ